MVRVVLVLPPSNAETLENVTDKTSHQIIRKTPLKHLQTPMGVGRLKSKHGGARSKEKYKMHTTDLVM
jgi:hypothetical protein